MPGDIVVVGSLNMDLVVRSARHPKPGETLLGGDFRTFPGGKGANQAVAAARIATSASGASTLVNMIGHVGDDAFGETLLHNLRDNHINTSAVTPVGGASGVALITVSDDGQNTIVVAPGANAELTPQDIRDAGSCFADAAVVLLQLEVPIPAIEHALMIARQHHVITVLNPAPAQPLERALLAQVDYLIPNQHELALLTGEVELTAGVDALCAIGVRNIIVTLGGDGVLFAQDGQRTHLPAYAVNVVDTTAAGDAFVGAFGAALAAGLSPLQAVHWGNAAGALAVTRAGAQPSLPSRGEVESLLARS